MNDLLGERVDSLLATLKARKIRVPSEIGAFLALEVCEQLMRGPAAVTAADVRVSEDGVVSLFVPPNSASSDDAARSVVSLLASLLVAAGTGVPSVLVRLVEEGAPTGQGALERLRDELESSLVPLNRGAARRVLSRMIREARRTSVGLDRLEAEATPQQLDASLDALIGIEDAPAAPVSRGRVDILDDPLDHPASSSRPAPRPAPPVALEHEEDPVDALLAIEREDDTGEREPTRPRASSPLARDASPAEPVRAVLPREALAREPERRDSPVVEPPRAPPPRRDSPAPPRAAPPPRPVQRTDDTPPKRIDESPRRARRDPSSVSMGLPDVDPPRRGSAVPWVVAIIVLLLATTATIALMRPDLVDMALGRPPPPPPPTGPTPEEQAEALRAHRARFGTVVVRSTPPEAQVFLYVGRGPAIASELSPGAAYELMAIADGRAPTRAVVPADATWETTPEGPRYELALQTSDTPMETASLELGATRLTGIPLGTPSELMGSVRVVTSPPGAKVYLLVGFTPDVRVENVRTEEAVELLVYLEGHEVERVVVGPSDWAQDAEGARSATLDVALRPRARGR